MTIHRVPQRSPEWQKLRCGKLTGSAASEVLAKGRGTAEPKGRGLLIDRLVAERLVGDVDATPSFVNAEMQRGIDMEPLAVALYEVREGVLVDTSVGFVDIDVVPAGYSPDGLVGDDGVLECKCPKTATHIGYLKDPSSLARSYMPQIMHGLWVTGREWCDIVSWDDRLPERYRYVRHRVHREGVADYERAARTFLNEVELALASLKGWSVIEEIA